MADTTQLGSKLKELRLKAGLSLRDVSEKSGVDDSLLSKIENGQVKKPTQANLNRLASFYDIEAEELYTLAGYTVSTTLPTYAPYLRSKYDLPPEAISELRQHFDYVKQKYQSQDNNDDETGQSTAA